MDCQLSPIVTSTASDLCFLTSQLCLGSNCRHMSPHPLYFSCALGRREISDPSVLIRSDREETIDGKNSIGIEGLEQLSKIPIMWLSNHTPQVVKRSSIYVGMSSQLHCDWPCQPCRRRTLIIHVVLHSKPQSCTT